MLKKRLFSFVLAAALMLGLVPAISMPARALGETYTTVAITHDYGNVLAIREDGSLWAWGDNFFAQIGNGEGGHDATYVSPVKIMDGVVSVGINALSSRALKADGSLWVWGEDRYGSLGVGNPAGETKFVTAPVKILDDVASISYYEGDFTFQDDCSYAVKTDGSLWGWGNNSYGQMGNGTGSNEWHKGCVTAPIKIMDGVASVTTAGFSTFAVKTDGSLWSWGWNVYGLLGDGTGADTGQSDDDVFRPTPVKIMDGVKSVYTSDFACFAIKTDGSLWSWGYNTNGQLGIGSKAVAVSTPTKVMDNVVSVESGYWRFFALKTDSTLWGWGYNGGRIGDGTKTHRSKPVKVMDNVASFESGFHHTLAIKKDGTLWSWGYNEQGEVGDGTTTTRTSPVKLMDGVAAAYANWYRSAVLKTDGTLWTWGDGIGFLAEVGFFADEAQITPEKVFDGVLLPGQAPKVPALTAKPTASAVRVNGKSVAFDAYNIEGNNYFKLRDLAYILSGTEKQFEVAWDGANNAISLTSGEAYTAVGGEMSAKGAGDKVPVATSSKIYLDGREVTFTAYNIEGNNYFKLRDIGQAFDFGVTWDGARNTIVIDTNIGYTPE